MASSFFLVFISIVASREAGVMPIMDPAFLSSFFYSIIVIDSNTVSPAYYCVKQHAGKDALINDIPTHTPKEFSLSISAT